MSSDRILASNDSEVRQNNNDSASRILFQQQDITNSGGADQRANSAADSAALVTLSTLPDLKISGHDSDSNGTSDSHESGFDHFMHNAETIASDLGTGAWNEIKDHPDHVIEAAAVGLAAGLAITAVAAVTAPIVGIGALAVGAIIGSVELATHIGGWIHDADVVTNTGTFSAAEVTQAHTDLQNVGGGATLVAAGALGGMAAGPVASAAGDVISSMSAASASADDASVSSILGNAVRSGQYQVTDVNGVSVLTPSASAISADAPATVAAVDAPATVAATDAPATVAATDAAPESAITPQPITLEDSIAHNQDLFRAAQADDAVVPSVKQLYQVHFEQAGPEGRLVPTLENPAGVQAPEGQWIATRLNADGTPNIENGMVNQWTPAEKDILKAYLVTPEQLAENSDLTAFTNTGAAPVHMVQLKAPIDFETTWGPMHGDAGDWLANYDYNTATGEPGTHFARVTAKSYADTYEPVN